MEIKGTKAVIVGGASGMARASAEMLVERGASVAILDLPTSAGDEVAKGLGAPFFAVDVIDEDDVEAAIGGAVEALDGLHIAVNTAGGGIAKRTLTKEGPHPLDEFRDDRAEPDRDVQPQPPRRPATWRSNEPEDDERGVIIDTASIAAFEGQIGQVAYTAAKAGIAGHGAHDGPRPRQPRHPGRSPSRRACSAPASPRASPTSSPTCSPRTPRSRSAWVGPRSTASSSSPSSRTRCSTAACIRLDAGQRFAPK